MATPKRSTKTSSRKQAPRTRRKRKAEPRKAAPRAGGKRIRYAVVGQGYISQIAILPAFANARRNSELVALVSDDPEKLRKLGKRYKVDRLLGYKDFEATTWYVLMAPSGTPPAIIDRINEITNAYLKSEGGQKMLVQFDVAAGSGTPKAAKEYLTSEIEKWRPIVKAANFKMPQ